eukprot:653298-Karenia_brevis.AAC.1
MAVAWAHRMQWLYYRWYESDTMPFIYTDKDYESYVEQLAFVDLQISMPLDLSTALTRIRSTAARIKEIKEIRPT